MSWATKVRIVIFLFLTIFAAMIIFFYLAVQQGWKAVDMCNDKFDEFEKVIQWRKL